MKKYSHIMYLIKYHYLEYKGVLSLSNHTIWIKFTDPKEKKEIEWASSDDAALVTNNVQVAPGMNAQACQMHQKRISVKATFLKVTANINRSRKVQALIWPKKKWHLCLMLVGM